MSHPDQAPRAAGRLHAPRTKITIAIAGAAVLAGGVLLRPRAVPPPIEPPKEHSAPLLEEEQRRAPFRELAGLQDVARQVAGYSLLIAMVPPAPPLTAADFSWRSSAPSGPAGYGVLVSPAGDALAHADALGGRNTIPVQLSDSTERTGRVTAYDPRTGLVLLKVDGVAGVAIPRLAVEPLRAGSVAAAAAPGQGGVVAPVFVTASGEREYRIAAGGAPILPGTPIFTFEGDLAAVAPGGDRAVAYPALHALAQLQSAAAAGLGTPASLGLTLQAAPAAGMEDTTAGVMVSDVVQDGPAAAAGILPGDVLTRVGGVPVDTVEPALRAIASAPVAAPLPIELLRGGEAQAVTAQPVPALTLRGRLQRSPREADTFPPFAALFGADRARAVRVPEYARVLAVDGEPVDSAAQVARRLRRSKVPALVYVQYDGFRSFVMVPPRP
jgi:S1-C subfamily serine protease